MFIWVRHFLGYEPAATARGQHGQRKCGDRARPNADHPLTFQLDRPVRADHERTLKQPAAAVAYTQWSRWFAF
jgi:hypothetical protein